LSGRRRNSDRRVQPRFEVVGDLWGTLEIVCPLPVLDISAGGALIGSDRPWQVGSVHAISVANGRDVGDARVCVRHVRETAESGHRFLIGLAFLTVSPALADEIAQWVALGGDAVES
jgi:hypothetical protein